MTHIFLVKCKQCKHDQKYHTNTTILTDKKKRCVYCGYTFSVKQNILRSF